MIEITDLSKQYGTLKVLENISITFGKGNVYGVAGENGAGKTTLFRCIAGLETYQGQIVSEMKPLKNCLGFLPAEPYFFPRMTAMEYIRLLANARKRKLDDIESKNIFDLPLNRYVSGFSTGMKKKLAITAILLQGNTYFLLDEPFNGIDMQGNLIVTEIIHRLKALNKTVILSSHIFSTLTETCDEICLLNEGKLCKLVQKSDFKELESEMKSFLIGKKIEKLNII
ncbi:MAG: ABC transporter ATP-binding protein [Prevotellaceae bacterium]|jgi:ABC-2 type transport system ATP-binding protein|nr:ABC transporter ATP-binding protein [Prevotellaceae bacterium]